MKPLIRLAQDNTLQTEHVTLGRFHLAADVASDGSGREWLFTDNVTNTERLYGAPNDWPYVKDGFHRYVVDGAKAAVNPRLLGTKAAAHYRLKIPAQAQVTIRLRLFADTESPAETFRRVLSTRHGRKKGRERTSSTPRSFRRNWDLQERRIARQAYAGLLWTKQFYHYVVEDWLKGDPNFPPPPESRKSGRNADWHHLFNRDVLSVPDKWEYPWYAAWDLAFHMIPFARLDPVFAKDQLTLLLREWYMHPNGQIPAYEFDLGDVNPPVHAWACWRVYKMTAPQRRARRAFSCQHLSEAADQFHLVGQSQGCSRQAPVFGRLPGAGQYRRVRPLPTASQRRPPGAGGRHRLDGLLLRHDARHGPGTVADSIRRAEDIASKFFEHFVYIADAINTIGGTGLWDEEDGFYYDQLYVDGRRIPLRVRSMVGLIPLFTVQVLDRRTDRRTPGIPETSGLVPHLSPRSGQAHFLHGDAG